VTQPEEGVVDELLRERREEVEAEASHDEEARRLSNMPPDMTVDEFQARLERRVQRVLAAQAARRQAKVKAA
jgi:hypothetical protein